MIRFIRPSRDLALTRRPSALGMALGALAFAASLTPSLIPRAGLMQGVLAGICFAFGYLLGYGLITLWNWMLEVRPRRFARGARAPGGQGGWLLTWRGFVRRGWPLRLALLLAVAVIGLALGNVTRWQNDIHAAMQIPPVESARPFIILATGLGVAAVLLLIGRLFRRLWRLIAAQLEPWVPPRVARVSGIALALMCFWAIGNDMVVGRVLAALDQSYAALDRIMPTEQAPPQDPLKAGSAASLASWEGLGAMGRAWVLDQPDAAAIAALTGRPAREPLRVYIGLSEGETPAERADLALREALRIGAFERARLVLAFPTGTGWMDPAAMRPLDYLSDGDLAVVAVQYSWLPSWMSLFLQPEYGVETADAVFAALYGHWRNLPEDTRPDFYLFGLSLGARNGELPISWPDLLSDPPAGALWAGPPFAMRGWQQLRMSARADSPAWAPRYRDGAALRVMNQAPVAEKDYAPWGVMRTVFLAYPSDPISFFDTTIFWRAPAWLQGSRGPDVSESLRWWPAITFLQLGFDMMTATTTPPGYGHVYAARDYLRAWDAVLGREADPALIARLTALFAKEGL